MLGRLPLTDSSVLPEPSSSSSSSASSSSGSSSSGTELKKTESAFGKSARSQEKRKLIRQKISEIVSALKSDLPLCDSTEYVEEVSKLLSQATIRVIATQKGWQIGSQFNKKIMVQKLLKDGWALPSTDGEIKDIYDAAVVTYTSKGSRQRVQGSQDKGVPGKDKAKEVDTGDDDKDDGPDVLDDLVSSYGSQRNMPPSLVPPLGAKPVGPEFAFSSGVPFPGSGPMLSSVVTGTSASNPFSLVEYGFGEILKVLAAESKLRTSLLQDKEAEVEDRINCGALPAAVTKALKAGQFTNLCNFWDRAVAGKRAQALGSVARSVSRDVKDIEWNDWIQAMLKIGLAYMDHGQGHIGRQMFNLLHGAMVLSASFQRQSVQEACEMVRRKSTSKSCIWGAQSLFEADVYVLLNSLPSRPVYTKSKSKRRYGDLHSGGLEKERGGFMSKRANLSGQEVVGSSLGQKKPRGNGGGLCRYWEHGERCVHDPCRFSHTCSACGPQVVVHDPSKCPRMAVASKLRRT